MDFRTSAEICSRMRWAAANENVDSRGFCLILSGINAWRSLIERGVGACFRKRFAFGFMTRNGPSAGISIANRERKTISFLFYRRA